MHRFFVLCLAVFTTAVCATVTVPGRFIVLYEDHLAKRSGLAQLSQLNYTIHSSYADQDIFHGASISVPEHVTATDLESFAGVRAAWPVRKLYLPATEVIGGDVSSAELARRAARMKRASSSSDAFSPHAMTGVDTAHALGYRGKGMKIAVLDGGIDYTNPILGGCFGKGCHISFGHAFVDDDGNSTSSADPFANCTAHGTHVAGIIGALPNPLGFTGAAPAAELGMIRIFDCNGSTSDDILIEGLLKARSLGADIISISVASGNGWIDNSPTELVIDSLVARGIFVSVAAGNDASEGLWFGESPSASRAGLSVGSVVVENLPGYTAYVAGHGTIPYLSPTPLHDVLPGTYDVVFTGAANATSDACEPLPNQSLAGKAVVIQRGNCTFVAKEKAALARNASLVLIVDDTASATIPYQTAIAGLTAVATLRNTDGARLRRWAAKGDLKITFPRATVDNTILNTKDGRTLDTLSTLGPTYDLFPAVQLSAPGKFILSTIPGGVGILSGTSMATPFVSALIALVVPYMRDVHGVTLTPAQLRALLQTTARPIHTEHSTASPYTSVAGQGAGLVSFDNIHATRTLIAPGILALNDTAASNYSQVVTFKNLNKYDMVYRFGLDPAETLATYDAAATSSILISTEPAAITPAHSATLSAKNNKIIVRAGHSASIRLTITPPTFSAANRRRFPVYSGFVRVSGQKLSGGGHKEKYTIPYFGLAAAAADMPVLDSTDFTLGEALPIVADGDGNVLSTYTASDAPAVYVRLAQGSPLLSIDVVDADIDFTPTIASTSSTTKRARRALTADLSHLWRRSRAHARDVMTSVLAPRSSLGTSPTHALSTRARKYSDTPTLGYLYYAPYSPRDYLVNYGGSFTLTEISINGTYTKSDGSQGKLSASKKYRILVRACRIASDPALEASYDSWLSPAFKYSA